MKDDVILGLKTKKKQLNFNVSVDAFASITGTNWSFLHLHGGVASTSCPMFVPLYLS